MRRPKASEGPLPDEKLVAWSKQPYGVGFQDVRKLAAKLLEARRKLAEVDVADIRALLSLSITELSAILDVKRPTIYSWLRGDSQPHPRNLERIAFLHQISQRWDELSGRPLRRHLRHAFDENGTTLFSLLKSDELDFDEIDKHLLALSKLPSSQKLPSTKELSAKHGLSSEAHPDAELIRDIESGRRLTND